MKHCPTCTCPQPTVETYEKNGVKVTKTTDENGTTVQADCECYGEKFRTHSRVDCPNRLAIVKANRGSQ